MYLNESLSEVREVSANDDVQELVDLINDGGQLSWTLTPSRLNQKLTSRGKLFGLYVEDKPVGVIGIKGATVDGIAGGEIGYLYIEKGHRSLPNAAKLYDKALSFASDYTFLMATTVTTNVAVNTLLKRSSKSYKVFTAKSPFSSNRLNYWLTYMNSGAFTREEIEEAFHEEFGHNVEETLTEDINFIGHQNTAFAKDIDKIASAVPMIHLADEPNEEDINIVFNHRGGLPNEDNTIYVGNKFVGKLQQHNTVKSHIPTIKTLSSSDGLENFIAKRNTGWKQQGQLINQEPDDPENYIFQPYLDIISEYRVVVYFMNGDYHVSGVYAKSGSNMSFKSITDNVIYKTASEMAKTATSLLGYGMSGVDLAIVRYDDNVMESIGSIASGVGKIAGKFSKSMIGDDEIMVFLEANTFPSLSNPMISNDIMKSVNKNKR